MMKYKKYYIIYNISLILFIIYFLLFPSYVIVNSTNPIENRNPIPSFSNETTINQEFQAKENYDSFGVFFATYQYIFKNGIIKIDLLDKDKNKHCTKTIYATSLTDTGPSKINCSIKNNRNYNLTITVKDLDKKHKLTLYSTTYDDNNTKLIINNKEKNYNLVMYYYQKKFNYSNIIYILLLIVFDMIIYPFIFTTQKDKEKSL